MGKKKKELPRLSPTLPIDLSAEPEPALLTALGGLPLVAQTFRSLKLHDSVERHVAVKQRERGFSEAEVVESLVLLHAAGGDCVDDLRRLKADEGLEAMLGHAIPSPEMVRPFLERFHSDEAVAAAKAARKPEQIAFIPKETSPLEGLARVNDDLVRETSRRMPEQRIATVDQDATIQESRKREALAHYEGGRGYQPMVAVWAETMLVLADEFRDGNVPAGMETLTVCQRSFRALPSTVEQYFYRADTASYDWKTMGWLRNAQRPDGPQGFIGFGISADMSPELKAVVVALPETEWTPYKAPGEELDTERDWAEVPFVPSEPYEHKDTQPLRYVGLRIRPRQGTLFADGSAVKHFAVVTNRTDLDGAKLLQWHREKAGTIEQVHDIVKNDLGGGVLPSKYFGANAAWFRVALLAHNVLVALKRIALPPELVTARPKRLRFQIFVQAGRLVSHARKLILRLRLTVERLADLLAAWRVLLAPA
jgi:hypothetical protein